MTHKVLRSVYSLIKNFIVAYGSAYPILVMAYGRMGKDKIGKPIKNMMRIVLKRGFSLLG